MKKMRFLWWLLFAGLLALFLTTCGWLGRSGKGQVVLGAKLVSLSVTPANPSIPVGVTKQFAASGKYSDGASLDLTRQVSWRSSKTAVATVNSSGLATSAAKGTAVVTATLGKISGKMTLTVTSVALSAIVVTPPNLIMSAGSGRQFTATGRYSDGTDYDLTTRVTWSSSNPSVATVSESGLATAVAAGTATITAASGTVLGNRTLTVTPLLSSISVNPANPSVLAGSYKLFKATGTYSDGTRQEITTQVTWSSSDTGIATVNYGGLATAVAAGTAIITAAQGNISGDTTLTVHPLSLSSITVARAKPSMPPGATQQLSATGVYSEGKINDITAQVTWSSSNPSVVTISESGLATAVAAGATTITATLGTVSGSTTITVTLK